MLDFSIKKLLLCFCIIFFFIFAYSNTSHSIKNLLTKGITNYACYYGEPDIPALLLYDLVIIESGNYTADQIAALKKHSIVTGYVSIGELNNHALEFFTEKTGWFLDKDEDGRPDKNEKWDSYYTNPADPLWQEFVLKKVKKIVEEKGAQGVFLDTLDTVDEYPEIGRDMAELVCKIRSNFPDIIIIANRGLTILQSISLAIDAVMFECFTSCYDFDQKQYKLYSDEELKFTHKVFETKLRPFMEKGGLVLALDYAEPVQEKLIDRAWSRAVDYGFIPAITQVKLDKVLFFTGKRDDKFLQKYGRDSKFLNAPNTAIHPRSRK